MGCSSSKLPATAPVIPAASRDPPDEGQGRGHGSKASSGSRGEGHSSTNYAGRAAGEPQTQKRASSGQRSPAHGSGDTSRQRDDPDGEGAGVTHATSVKASGVAISTGGAAGGAGSGSIGTHISSDTRSRKRSLSGASSGRRNGSRQFTAPGDQATPQAATAGVTGPASSGSQRARKGSVEAARPSQKLGAGGEANVAAALRSKRRGQIIAESMPVDVRIHKPVFEKSPEVRKVISAALKENVLTSSLGPDVIRDLVNATQPRDVDASTEIITQGDVGDNFYVIESGKFDILVNGVKVATFGDGTPNKSFGELALLFNSPRAASVVASTTARVWWLGRDTFRGLVATSSHEEHGRVKAALARGILSGLDTEQIERVAGAATRVRFNDGDQVIRKGAEGSVFYVILEGEVLCTNIGGGQSDNVLSKGDYFGERALIKHEPRAADVFAQGNTDLIALSREDFEAQLGGLRALLEHNLGLRLLLCVPFLGALEETARTRLFGELRLVQYKAGRAIARRGRKLKKFRIIKEGTVRIDLAAEGAAANAEDQHTLLPGQWFGEGELLTDTAADATVVAVSPVQCFELSAEAFRDLLSAVPVLCAAGNRIQDKRKITPEEAAKARRSGLKVAERVEAAAAGAASARRGDGPLSSRAAERAAVAAAGAAASSGAAVSPPPQPAPAPAKSSSRRPKRKRRPMLELAFSDLEQRATLGTGTFGRVKLVVHRPTGTPYALKALQKSQIVAMRQQKNVIREKEILAVVDHPFVIKLFQTFKDKHRLYMLLELVQGGELFSRMQGATHAGREGILSPDHSRFYAACVADALAHLHERHVAYRDLKPENLLIDSAGFIKVVDFGFAKVVRDRTYTLCGTPEYLAPELISGKGHSRGVDWWALGILIFEMASGYSPYMDERDDQLRVARNIMRAELKFPDFVTDRALQAIVRALLSRDVSKRLGMLRGGAADVRSHPFFSSINWDDLLTLKVKTPWAPKIRSSTDTANFDKYDEDEQLERYVPEPGALAWDRDF